MRHRVKSNKLNRAADHRRAMNRFMATSFIEKGVLVTTLPKAKFIQPYVEKMVTVAKGTGDYVVKFLTAGLNTKTSINELINRVAPKFALRKGGYTRIIKLGNRVGDNAALARLEWVESMEKEEKKAGKEKKQKTVKEVGKKVKAKKEKNV